MRGLTISALMLLALASCADPAPQGSGGSDPPAEPARVDLVEAGLRAVLPEHADGLYVLRRLCTTDLTGDSREVCGEPLTPGEMRALEEGLSDVSAQVWFVDSYKDIPEGQAPIDGSGATYAWVSQPQAQSDGSYSIEAGETCGGLCGHGGWYVLEERAGGWVSTGNVPGTGQWIS